MLNPQNLENIPQPFIDLFEELETFIIQDMSRRIKKTTTLTATAEWQKNRAELYNIRNIEQKIAATLKLYHEEIERLFPDIAAVSIEAESVIYKEAGYKTIQLNESQELRDYLKAAIKNTKGDIENITRSLGFAETQNGHVVYNSVAKFYQKELNSANIKITSGVQDYQSAIRDAVKKLSQSGLRYVNFESNWSNNLDVAVRRSILTSVHQMTQEMTNSNMDKIITDKNQQFVEVSAHSHSRESHKKFQGKVFKVVGSTKEYPNLAEYTGLGTIEGLGGINCHHSYAPFVVGASVRIYTDEELKKIDPPNFEYKGKEYNAYEATQYQRKIETAMRESKRQLIATKEAGLEEDFKSTSIKLQQQRREYKEFSKASGLREKNERSQVLNFNQSISKQAANIAKKG